jgi:hypothetical protein
MTTTTRLSEPLRAVLLSLLRQAGRPMSTAELATALRQVALQQES